MGTPRVALLDSFLKPVLAFAQRAIGPSSATNELHKRRHTTTSRAGMCGANCSVVSAETAEMAESTDVIATADGTQPLLRCVGDIDDSFLRSSVERPWPAQRPPDTSAGTSR